MKKKVAIVLLAVAMCVCATACNKQMFDTTYSYDKAIISLPNGEVVEGKVQSWKDFDDGDQIQVKIDGKMYLVHSTDIALINE